MPVPPPPPRLRKPLARGNLAQGAAQVANDQSQRREHDIKLMGDAYEGGAAQSDFDDPAESADVVKEYDMIQSAAQRRRRTLRNP